MLFALSIYFGVSGGLYIRVQSGKLIVWWGKRLIMEIRPRAVFFFFSVERKVCFIFSAGNRAGNEGGGHLSKDILTLTDNQWARAFIGRGRGLHSESAQSALTVIFLFFLFFFNFYFFIFYLWWILSYIEMKQPWVYMCSPSQSPLPPPSPPVPSRFSQCTRSERLSHASNLGWWSVSP